MENKGYSAGGLMTFWLTLTFVVLKLCKVINWSWWWVLSPVWITAGLVGLIFLGYAIYILVLYIIAKRQ